MEHRHYGRSSSPGSRRIAHPERYSAGNLAGYDQYPATRSTREYISPRSSGDRVIVPHSPQYAPHPSSSSNSNISRSSAGYDAYSGRPRRSTLEGDSRRPANLSLSSRHRPAVIHANDNRPSSPLARAYDDRDRGRESYVNQPTPIPRREHKKVYSVDDGQSRLIDERDVEPRREQRPNAERSGHKSTHVGGSRQQYHPSAQVQRDNEEYYSYTDPAKMYSETEPSWRPRRGSVGRGSRPSSVIIEPSVAPRITREYGPPPSTRGFDRINGGVSRAGSVRDTHKRNPSRERERQNLPTTVYRDGLPEPYILPQDVPPRSNSAIPAPRTNQDFRDDRHGRRDYDDRRDGKHHQRRLTYEDPEVATRGFGIRSGSADRYARDSSLDRTPLYPAPTVDAVPVTIPNPRDFLPNESAPPPIPPLIRDKREGRREHDRGERGDRGDREWVGELERERERDRDRDYREKHRDNKDRERERDRDRPRDRDRERDYARDEVDRERDRDRDRDRDRYPDRDDRVRTKEVDDRHHHKEFIPAVAVAGTAAAAAAAYGSHVGERKGRDDRRDDRRYEDDRRVVQEDRRPPIAALVDHRPMPQLEERKAPPPPDEWGVNVEERRSTATPIDQRVAPAERRPPTDDRRLPVDERRGVPVASLDMRATHDDRRALPTEDYRGAVDDRKSALPDGRSRPSHKLSSESINAPRERHYVDKDNEREASARQEPKSSEPLDPDEDYRRRLQAVQADLKRSSTAPPPRDRDSSDSERERRRREYDPQLELHSAADRSHQTHPPTTSLPKNMPGAYPIAAVLTPREADREYRDRAPPQSDRLTDRSKNGLFGAPLVNDPEEYTEKAEPQDQERDGRVQIVAPPKGSPPAPKGILRRPTAKFPEDPNPIREGVAPLKDAKKGKDIPINARWTKIDRRLVNPEALKEAKERFEERLDCVIVLRVLSKEDIQKLADRTREIRERREESDRDDDRYREYDREDRPRERHRRRERRRDGYDDDTESDFYSDEYDDRERKERDRESGREYRRNVEASATTPA